MRLAKKAKLTVGSRIGANLSVLGAIDEESDEPVYVVWHHPSWCPMACKVFTSDAKIQREANFLWSLAHPNIVRCLGIDKPCHLLMEFLEGPTLRSALRKQPKGYAGISDAMRVAIHLGAALQHVHERGYLHLDVKPSNIILVHGRPVLFDFGIARSRNQPRPNETLGTDPYIAPEECLCQPVTPAADVFGFGVTIYQMLTGHRPFPEGSRRCPYPQVRQPPTSARHYRPSIPLGLDELVLSCVNRDPAARPSLVALLPALHEFIRTGPPMWPPGFCPADTSQAVLDHLSSSPIALSSASKIVPPKGGVSPTL